MIKGVIFDVDGVLLDSFESNLEFFQELMRSVGQKPPTAEEYTPLFHLKLWDVLKNLSESKDNNAIDRLYDLAQHGDFRTKLGIIPERAEETIKELSGLYSLAIVTSRLKQFVYEPPMDTLKSYFAATVSQEDTKTHKPSGEPLLLAAEKLNLSPRECVYIGDVENDFIAARAAGMTFLLFSKTSLPGVGITTSNFSLIPVLLKTL